MERELKGQGLAQGHDRLFSRLESCGLPKDVIQTLFSRHTLVRYPKGSPLFEKGSPADVVFVVLSGIVKIYRARADSPPAHQKYLENKRDSASDVTHQEYRDGVT